MKPWKQRRLQRKRARQNQLEDGYDSNLLHFAVICGGLRPGETLYNWRRRWRRSKTNESIEKFRKTVRIIYHEPVLDEFGYMATPMEMVRLKKTKMKRRNIKLSVKVMP